MENRRPLQKNKLKSKVIRWFLFLPFSFLCLLIAQFIVHIALYVILRIPLGFYPEAPERIIMPFLVPIAMAYGACTVAPSHKKQVGVSVAVVCMIMSVLFVVLAVMHIPFLGERLHINYFGTPNLLCILGSLLTIMGSKIRYKEQKE